MPSVGFGHAGWPATARFWRLACTACRRTLGAPWAQPCLHAVGSVQFRIRARCPWVEALTCLRLIIEIRSAFAGRRHHCSSAAVPRTRPQRPNRDPCQSDGSAQRSSATLSGAVAPTVTMIAARMAPSTGSQGHGDIHGGVHTQHLAVVDHKDVGDSTRSRRTIQQNSRHLVHHHNPLANPHGLRTRHQLLPAARDSRK